MADNQGSGCGLMLGIIALLIGVPLFILVIAISEGEEEPQASCRPGTTEDESAIPEEYREALESAADESGLSVDLLAAQIDAESGWNPDATSPVGAQGIVQFMPQAWDTYGDGGDPFNAQDAIAAMGRYMAAVADEVTDLAGNERELAELSLAAYNAGPGAVQSAGGIDRRLPVAMTARIRRSLTGRSSALQPTHANVKCDSQRLLAVSSQRHMSPLRRVGRWFIGQVISLHLQQCADDDGRGCVFVCEGGPDYGW